MKREARIHRIRTIYFLVVLAAASSDVAAQTSSSGGRSDEDSIRAVMAATTDAFSRHDAKAWVKFCTPDAQRRRVKLNRVAKHIGAGSPAAEEMGASSRTHDVGMPCDEQQRGRRGIPKVLRRFAEIVVDGGDLFGRRRVHRRCWRDEAGSRRFPQLPHSRSVAWPKWSLYSCGLPCPSNPVALFTVSTRGRSIC